jgi:putative hemolysin
MGEGLAASYGTGRDEDVFDSQCQHLMVVHADSGETIGTYRLQVAEMARAAAGFYSATEFDLSTLPDDVIASSVELGRACIREDHRNRETLFLLWRGLAAYMLWNGKQRFFGCSSLTSSDPAEGVRAFRELGARGHVHPTLRVPPLPGFECVADDDLSAPEVHIPTLFRTYLRYGAKVLGPPAIDRAFGTVDFLTLLDVTEMDPSTFATFAR